MGLLTETDFCPYVSPRNSRCEQLESGFCQVVMTATWMNPILSAGDPLWVYVGARAWKPMPEAEQASAVAGATPRPYRWGSGGRQSRGNIARFRQQVNSSLGRMERKQFPQQLCTGMPSVVPVFRWHNLTERPLYQLCFLTALARVLDSIWYPQLCCL